MSLKLLYSWFDGPISLVLLSELPMTANGPVERVASTGDYIVIQYKVNDI